MPTAVWTGSSITLTSKLQSFDKTFEFEERARRNVDAMVLRTDAPVDLDLASVRWGIINASDVRELFEELEFNSLYERLGELVGGDLRRWPRKRIFRSGANDRSFSGSMC